MFSVYFSRHEMFGWIFLKEEKKSVGEAVESEPRSVTPLKHVSLRRIISVTIKHATESESPTLQVSKT